MFKAYLIGNRVLSNAAEALSLYEKSRFGEKFENKIQYSLVEALYLLKRGRMEIFKNNRKISDDAFSNFVEKKEKNSFACYSVYSALRERGYIVKTALKFGADFRVYEKAQNQERSMQNGLFLLFMRHPP